MTIGKDITRDEPYETDQPVATHFHDMHSGGYTKTAFHHIFVELPEEAAREWFTKEFHENPDAIACHCCGPNFSVKEGKDLRQATAYERWCAFAKVEGEDGGGHWIEEPRTGSVDHVPFEEFIENAASDPDDREPKHLVVTAEDLGEAWEDEVVVR